MLKKPPGSSPEFSLKLTQPAPCHPGPTALPQAGSRRRRLWELAQVCHCPLVGVSLPIDTLVRLTNRAFGASLMANDYEVHAGAVSECARRSKLSELMQNELDTRYAREITAFKLAKSPLALAELWIKHLRSGDVAGAFWAGLTHPRCTAELEDAMCKDLHMFQHQAGAGVRLEIARFNALADENGVLARELAKVQERMTRVMGQKAVEMERMTTELVQARAAAIAKDSRIAFLAQDLEALHGSIPQLEDKQRLQKRLDQMAARQTELEAQNAELRRKVATSERAATGRLAAGLALLKVSDADDKPAPPSQPIAMHLHHKVVLCVGGRSGNLANYRDVVERIGGHFTHHDGGVEDNVSVLDANLAAADLVICQTGCISHNAYWRVKDFCKRTGKRCVFVENPSTSSLERGLDQAFAAQEEGAVR